MLLETGTISLASVEPMTITLNPPTAVPPFPQQRIATGTLTQLGPRRQIGYGQAQQADIAPASNMVAIATSAGIAWFELPSLRHLRFNPIEGGMETITFNPQGQFVATSRGHATSQATTIIWDTATGAQLVTIEGTDPIFSPDGTIIATVKQDVNTGETSTLLWRVEDGAKLATLVGSSPRFSPTGQQIVTVQDDDTTTQPATLVWHSTDGTLLRDLVGRSPAFSPDGRLLAVATESEVRIWTMREVTPVRKQDIQASQQGQVLAFSDNGQQLYIVVDEGIKIWNVMDDYTATNINLLGTFGESNNILINFLGGGEGLLTGIRLVNLQSGTIVYEDTDALFSDRVFNNQHYHVSFSRQDDLAALVTLDGWVRIINLNNGVTNNLYLQSFSRIAFSPDGETLATARTGPAVDLWRVSDGVLQAQLPAAWGWTLNRAVRDVSFSSDGARLIAEEHIHQYGAASSVALTTWDVLARSAGTEAWNVTVYDENNTPGEQAWAFSPAIGAVAWVNSQNYIQFQHTKGITTTTSDTGAMMLTGPGTYTALEFNPDGSLLAVGDGGGAVQLLKTDSGYLYDTVQAGCHINRLFFSPDSTLVAAHCTDGMLMIWRVGEQTPMMQLSTGARDKVLFTSDNQMVITGGEGGLTFYVLSTGQVLHNLDTVAQDIALDPTHRLLAVLHHGRVTLWGVP
jgi:WD40 repeat protein